MKKAILYTVLVVTVVAALGAVGRMDVEAEKQEQQIQRLREQQMKQDSQRLKESRAYSICMEAHRDFSSDTEQSCSKALDDAHATFNCSMVNDVEEGCWLEAL